MTLNLSMPGHEDLKPRITVFGVGGAGGNAVDNMIEKALDGVEFVVANTDAQALQQARATAKIQMGIKATEGLGAGAKAAVGAKAAEESIEQIVDHLAGAHMCFITAGMGGGTGTGAAPIIAQAARELGVLTVGVVTKPFQFEGGKRMRQAEAGVEALQKVVDTLIIIPNQNLFRLANENTTFTEAFSLADDVLYQGVKGVTDLMVRPGLINLDFADVRAVMDEMGKAMMGTGEATGEDRAVQAASKAVSNPLLDEISLRGAKGVLINITGGEDLTLFELDEAANKIREEVDPDANIIVGSTLDPAMEGAMRVSVVATGIDANIAHGEVPNAQVLSSAVATAQAGEQKPLIAPSAAPRVADAEPAFIPPVEESAVESVFTSRREVFGADDVPPPAFTPEPAPADDIVSMDPADSFVAPQAPRPGTPTPEALARLRAAVEKVPESAAPATSRPTIAAAHTPVHAPATAPAPSAVAEDDNASRFGIGGFIDRMKGQSADPAPEAYERDSFDMNEDQKRDIPAFLRRQAN